MNISIIGTGLIGGSMAVDLKVRGFASVIFGVDNNPKHCEKALQRHLVDEIVDLKTGIANSDLIIIATPVDKAIILLSEILDNIDKQIVTDVCSTKYELCQSVKNHPKRKQYVASHPMAGTEFSGPEAAQSALFDNKTAIICDISESNTLALEKIISMYKALNMKPVYMNSKSHDVHAAYVSHISHISSFALALTVLEKEKDENQILNMAGGGFKSTVRLAKSSKEMWVPIFNQNSKNIINVLDTYINVLEQFKYNIRHNDFDNLHKMIEESNKIGIIV